MLGNCVRVVTTRLIEEVGKLPPNTVIGIGDHGPVTASAMSRCCSVQLPDGALVPMRWIEMERQQNGGYSLETIPSGSGKRGMLISVPASSPIIPFLQTLEQEVEARQHRTITPEQIAEARKRNEPDKFQLKNAGGTVRLIKFAMVHTYERWLEGDPRAISFHILEKLAERAWGIIGQGPVVVLPPEYIPLPEFLCVIALDRFEGGGSDESMLSSRLSIAWFMERLDKPLCEMIESAVASVDWAKHAQRYEWEP
jgi:hypothetical protein